MSSFTNFHHADLITPPNNALQSILAILPNLSAIFHAWMTLKVLTTKKLLYSIFFSSYSYLSSALKNNDGMAILMLNAYHGIFFSSDIRMRICSLMSKKAEVKLWRGRNTIVITLTTEMFKENPIISHFHPLFKPTHTYAEREMARCDFVWSFIYG